MDSRLGNSTSSTTSAMASASDDVTVTVATTSLDSLIIACQEQLSPEIRDMVFGFMLPERIHFNIGWFKATVDWIAARTFSTYKCTITHVGKIEAWKRQFLVGLARKYHERAIRFLLKPRDFESVLKFYSSPFEISLGSLTGMKFALRLQYDIGFKILSSQMNSWRPMWKIWRANQECLERCVMVFRIWDFMKLKREAMPPTDRELTFAEKQAFESRVRNEARAEGIRFEICWVSRGGDCPIAFRCQGAVCTSNGYSPH